MATHYFPVLKAATAGMTTLALANAETTSETSCPATVFAEFSSEDGALAVVDLCATITKSAVSPDGDADIAQQPQDTVVPEPATATPSLLALTPLAARRRRRRRAAPIPFPLRRSSEVFEVS